MLPAQLPFVVIVLIGGAATGPLYVVDEVQLPVSSDPNYISPVTGINPNDIESIEVLKDAAATAIYGAMALEWRYNCNNEKKVQKARPRFPIQDSMVSININSRMLEQAMLIFK